MSLIDGPTTLAELILNGLVRELSDRGMWLDDIDDDVLQNDAIPELVKCIQSTLDSYLSLKGIVIGDTGTPS